MLSTENENNTLEKGSINPLPAAHRMSIVEQSEIREYSLGKGMAIKIMWIQTRQITNKQRDCVRSINYRI